MMSGGVPSDWTHHENVGIPSLPLCRGLKTPGKSHFTMTLSTLSPPSPTSLCFVSQGTNHMQLRRIRRSRIPDKPNYSLNLWSIMKNCIGKDLSRIPMPVKTHLVQSSKFKVLSVANN